MPLQNAERTPLAVLAVAALAGCGTMSVELAAVRLLAPWFGTSLAVWTNVIGVVLLALALGYAWGARSATIAAPFTRLGMHLVAGGVLCALLPALAAPICNALLPEELALEEAASLFRWGSLAASSLLFLPPALVLGAVPPLAVEVLQRSSGGSAGAAGGRVLFTSTLGSLVGTFATTHVLVPGLGLRLSFLGVGALLALAGGCVLMTQGRARTGAGGTLLLLLSAGSWGAYERPRPANAHVVAEVESAYQFLRVVERGSSAAGDLERQLQVNEGLDSYQSLWRPRAGLLGDGEFYYYDPFALPACWSGVSGEWRLLVLGLGAGTTVRILDGSLPTDLQLDVTGVELDPVVVELGRAHMEMPSEGEHFRALAGVDARAALRALAGPFEQIVLDTYANQTEIPSHLATVEFFEELEQRLTPGGWLCINVGAFDLEDPVLLAVGASAASAFGRAASAFAVPASRNVVLFLRRDAEVPQPSSAQWEIDGAASVLLPRLALAAHRREIDEQAGAVLTDDRAGLEQLQLASLQRARDVRAQGFAP